MIRYLSTIKGSLFIFFSLFLLLTHLAMIYKKRASLLSFKMGKDILQHGKTDTFESIC
jgi:hypothetical protein